MGSGQQAGSDQEQRTGITVGEDGKLSRGLMDGNSIVWGDIAAITGLTGLGECRWW